MKNLRDVASSGSAVLANNVEVNRDRHSCSRKRLLRRSGDEVSSEVRLLSRDLLSSQVRTASPGSESAIDGEGGNREGAGSSGEES